MTLRVLIVDDETPARDKVRRYLTDDSRFQIVGEAADGVEALERIESLKPNVLVLDVQMPGLGGFDVLSAMNDGENIAVVFSTAHDAHALRAFEAHAVDYLLKPYDAERFRRAMNKVVVQQAGADVARRAMLADPSTRDVSRLVLRTVAGAWVVVPSRDIVRLRASNKHTRVQLANGTEHVVRRPLTELEGLLDENFVRIHRNEIARVEAISQFESLTHGDALLVFTDGSTSVLTRTFRERFLIAWKR